MPYPDQVTSQPPLRRFLGQLLDCLPGRLDGRLVPSGLVLDVRLVEERMSGHRTECGVFDRPEPPCRGVMGRQRLLRPIQRDKREPSAGMCKRDQFGTWGRIALSQPVDHFIEGRQCFLVPVQLAEYGSLSK